MRYAKIDVSGDVLTSGDCIIRDVGAVSFTHVTYYLP